MLVEATGLINDEQFGFRADRSSVAPILIMKTLLARASRAHQPFYMCCLDISKAYDNVNHEKLWELCNHMGISGDWLQCIQAIYSNGKVQRHR